jgi:hypothetical protein
VVQPQLLASKIHITAVVAVVVAAALARVETTAVMVGQEPHPVAVVAVVALALMEHLAVVEQVETV